MELIIVDMKNDVSVQLQYQREMRRTWTENCRYMGIDAVSRAVFINPRRACAARVGRISRNYAANKRYIRATSASHGQQK